MEIDAHTELSRLLERAHAGEKLNIAKSGEPYVLSYEPWQPTAAPVDA